MSHSNPDSRFPTTHWSIVVRLNSADTAEARKAIEEVFTTYRYPLYGYLRSSGMNHEDAEDVLQGFFEKMLRNDTLGAAKIERGRLRTFLLSCLSRFKLNWHRDEQRRRNRVSAEADLWDADEARYQRDSHATQETPELFYERRWAAGLIARVRERLREQCVRRQKEALHDFLSPMLTQAEPEPGTFAATAVRLGLSENALRVALHRLRKDFRALLHEEVKRTLDEDQDVRTEIRHLLELFEK
jgi:DNA-directed RNA polymerase specialized sigma24 family protein